MFSSLNLFEQQPSSSISMEMNGSTMNQNDESEVYLPEELEPIPIGFDHERFQRPQPHVGLASLQQQQGSSSFNGLSRQTLLSSSQHLDQNKPPEEPIFSKEELVRAVHHATEGIALADKQAYLEAMNRCPELVNTETDPMQFLRYCHHDTWAAASRLCCNWKFRVEFFGPSKAFLPMDLTGNGALDAAALETFGAGSLPLPNLSNGRGAILIDRRLRKERNMPTAAALIYMLTKFAQFEWAQDKNGLQIFHVFVTQSRNAPKLDFGGLRTVVNFLTHAAPVRTTAHLLVDVGGISALSQHFATLFLEIAHGLGFDGANKWAVHKFRSPAERMQQLMLLGVLKEELPVSLGGTWQIPANRLQWIRQYFEKWGHALSFDRYSMGNSDDAARDVVHEAVKYIQHIGKASYLEAMTHCPELVNTESDPLQFLRYASFDSERAAERLCQYWFQRILVFESKAFLPLNLTGKGALDRDEIKLLQASWLAKLPILENGQHVLFVDRRLLLPCAQLSQKLKVFFYIFMELATHRNCQKTGIQYINLLVMPRMARVDFDFEQMACLLMSTAFPVKIHMKLLVHQPRPYPPTDSLVETYVGIVKEMEVKFHDFRIISEKRKQMLLHHLSAVGISADGLPESVGGSWKCSKMIDWVVDRIKREKLKSRGTSSTIVPVMSAEERKAARRASNAIHSRRKREKQKAIQATLEEEQREAEAMNKKLKTEQKHLESLLEQASECVSCEIRSMTETLQSIRDLQAHQGAAHN